jgi:hypothetical protein
MVLKKDNDPAQTDVGVTQEAAGAAQKKADTINPQEDKNTTASNQVAREGENQKASKCFVYIGPTLPNGRLKGNAIFSGSREEVTAHLADVLEIYPLVNDLIIPVEELAEQRVKASTPGNYINKCYKDVVAAAKK